MLTPPTGLAVYLDSHDLVHIDETIATLERCAAVSALALIESVDGRRQPVERVRSVCIQLRAANITPILYSFPNVHHGFPDVGYAAPFAHYARCREATNAPGQWDVEPISPVWWAQSGLDKLLDADPHASITSTRAQAKRLDLRDRRLWLQLEAQTSVDHLDEALARWPDAVLVTGVFDEKDDSRTVDEVRRDLDRCTAQARRTGTHGVWSAHTITPAKADLLREWALATWAPPPPPTT